MQGGRWCVESQQENSYFCFFGAVRRFDFFFLDFFPGLASDASSRRRFAAHPGLFTCRPRAIPKPSAGTLSVIVEPAAIYAPLPIRTGAIRAESLPINTLFPIVVGNLWKPS